MCAGSVILFMAIERLSWLDVLWLEVYCDEESDGGELVAAATGSTSKTKSKLVTSQVWI